MSADRQTIEAYSKVSIRALDELLAITKVLRGDIEDQLAKFDDNRDSQLWRRNHVRMMWAMFEGVIFNIKQFTLVLAVLSDNSLTDEERIFLSDKQYNTTEDGISQEVAVHQPTLSNIKETFKLCARLFDLDWKPNFGDSLWAAVKLSLEVRHRVTHPKKVIQLEITDEEIEFHHDAMEWFIEHYNSFQMELLKRYPDTAV